MSRRTPSGPERPRTVYTPEVHAGVGGDVIVPSDGRRGYDPPVMVAAALSRRDGVRMRLVGLPDATDSRTAVLFAAIWPAGARRLRANRLDGRLHAQVRRAGLECGGPIAVAFGAARARATGRAAVDGLGVLVLRRGEGTPVEQAAARDALLVSSGAKGCPVLALAAQQKRLPTRALVAVDGSPASVAAAHAALQLVGAGGVVHLCYVVDDTIDRGGPEHAAERRMEAAAVGGVVLSRLRAELSVPSTTTIEVVLLAGAPGRTLLAYAAKHEVDLIAAGSRRLGAHHAEGSVTARLLRLATCAVLVAAPRCDLSDLRVGAGVADPVTLRARRAD